MSHPFSNHFPPKPHRDVGGGEMVDILVLTNVLAQIPCNQHRFFYLKFFGRFDWSFCQNFMVNLLTFHVGFDLLVISHVASEELGRL